MHDAAVMSAPVSRSQTTVLSVEDLVERVRRGDIRVPPFQRLFRWGVEDVEKLLDSVYQGYPIGTLLFWQRPAPAALVELGPVKIDAPEVSSALWVVDGQQRITSLVSVLLFPATEEPTRTSKKFELYFDLSTGAFIRPRQAGKAEPSWLPMNVALDGERVLEWLDRYPLRGTHPDHTRAAIKLNKVIREYTVPAYIVQSQNERVVRTIFDRLNTRGKRLQGPEVFHALHSGLSAEEPSNLKELSRALAGLRFGEIEERWLLKSLMALQGRDVTREQDQFIREEQDLPSLLKDAERALRAVIVFLKRDVGIPRIELLPYKLPLLPLARFFHQHPEPSPRSRSLLARWIWRGAITGVHRAEIVPMVRESIAAISGDQEQSVQKLLGAVPKQNSVAEIARSGPLEMGTYRFNRARTKLQVNALLSLRPRHVVDGHELDLPTLFEEHGSGAVLPLFASPADLAELPLFVARRSATEPERGRETEWLRHLANHIVHPSLEGRALSELLLEITPEVRESHAIPPEALDALRARRLLDFFHRREAFLLRHITTFLDAKARWLESDRMSIAALIAPAEG